MQKCNEEVIKCIHTYNAELVIDKYAIIAPRLRRITVLHALKCVPITYPLINLLSPRHNHGSSSSEAPYRNVAGV